MTREHTKTVKIGNRLIGGGNPVLIQSMCNTKTEDVKATVGRSCVWNRRAARSSGWRCPPWRPRPR